MPILTLVNTGKFFWLYILVVSHMFYCYYISNQFKQFGFTGGLDDQTLTTIGAAGALFNGCFKVVWATLLDYYNFKPVFSVIICVVMLCLATIHWAVYNQYAYTIVVCLSFMCDGATAAMLPVVTKQVFGQKRGSSVYSYLWSSFGVASILGALSVKTFLDLLGYDAMLLVCTTFSSLTALITFFYKFELINYADLAQEKGIDIHFDDSDYSKIQRTINSDSKSKTMVDERFYK